jgi:hypothetical protein
VNLQPVLAELVMTRIYAGLLKSMSDRCSLCSEAVMMKMVWPVVDSAGKPKWPAVHFK